MNRQEAIQALKDGKKITHRLFTKDEYVKMMIGQSDILIDEAGYYVGSIREFHADRRHNHFESDWSIFQEE